MDIPPSITPVLHRMGLVVHDKQIETMNFDVMKSINLVAWVIPPPHQSFGKERKARLI